MAAVGPGVTELKEGDKVGVAWLHDSCLRCGYCGIGWKTLCEHQRNTGYSCDGGFAEYVIAAAPFVGRLPDKVDFVAIAPILCAGVTTYKGHDRDRDAAGSMGGDLRRRRPRPYRGSSTRRRWACMSWRSTSRRRSSRWRAARGGPGGRCARAGRDSFDPEDDGGRRAWRAGHGRLAQRVLAGARRGAPGRNHGLIGLPPGDFGVPISRRVLKRLTIRARSSGPGAILHEAIAFATEGKVRARIQSRPARNINAVFADLKNGKVDGRVVLTID